MAVTSELNANLGLCVFVWMYPRNLEEVGFLEESIKKNNQMKSHSIVFYWTPRDRRHCPFFSAIATGAPIGACEEFCKRTEFHSILDGIAVITNVDPENECAPCIYPNTSKLDHCPYMDCSPCARYSRRPNDGGVLKVRVDLPLGKREGILGKVNSRLLDLTR